MRKVLLILVAIISIIPMISCTGSSSNYRPEKSSGYKEDYKPTVNKGSNDRPETSSGYKEGFEPTVNENGDFHTINGDAKQVQYQGSQEQKKDLDAIDKYAAEHPEF